MYRGDCKKKKKKKQVDFEDLFLRAIFAYCKRFLAKTNYNMKILHLFGTRWAKNFAIIFDGFDTRKERFPPGQRYFFALNFI